MYVFIRIQLTIDNEIYIKEENILLEIKLEGEFP